MAGDANRDVEAVARRELARLIDAIAVDDPVEEPAPPPSRHWGRPLLVAAAALVLAGTGAVVALGGDEDADVVTDRPEACTEQVASEGVLADGVLNPGRILERGVVTPETPYPSRVIASGDAAGQEWLYAVAGGSPEVEHQFFVDGTLIGAGMESDAIWSSGPGRLPWALEYLGPGVQVLHGSVPVGVTQVDVDLPDGTEQQLCPVQVPGIDGYEYVAAVVPADVVGAEITALTADGEVVARGSADEVEPPGGADVSRVRTIGIPVVVVPGALDYLPADASTTTVPPRPGEAVAGDLPTGRWSLTVRLDQDELTLEASLPGDAPAASATASVGEWLFMAEPWNLQAVDGRLFIWGVVPDQVTVVWVQTTDGAWTPIPAVDPGVSGFDGRVFARPLGEGVLISQVTATDDAGKEYFQAVEVAEKLARLAEFQEQRQVALAVVGTGG